MDDVYAAGLLRNMLSWDFWQLSQQTEEGLGAVQMLRPLPQKFSSVEEYLSYFEPLVLEECGAQLLRGNEEGVILQPHRAAQSRWDPKAEFTLVSLTLPPGAAFEYSYNDMVLLSRDDPFEDSPDQAYHALGAVEQITGDQFLTVRLYLGDNVLEGAPGQAGHASRAAKMRQRLTGSSTPTWHVLKLANIATVTREWVGLHAIEKVPFSRTLLAAGRDPARSMARPRVMPQGMAARMGSDYNASQLKAVSAALDGTSVVLIQGPPGTGKTSTILGLLSLLLHAQPQPIAIAATGNGTASTAVTASQRLPAAERIAALKAASPWLFGLPNPRDQVKPWDAPGDRADAFGLLAKHERVRISSKKAPRPRVMVCAPSNSALDEIVLRLLRSGLMDADGKTYTPNVVRVGVNVHHSVASVALDALVDHRLEAGGGSKGSGAGAQKWERDRLRAAVLEDADIACSTLSFAGAGIFKSLARGFDAVVVDEAAQAVEPATLIPLALKPKQLFLVGDPVQLPATVISQRAVEHCYDTSLFSRLQSAGYPVQILDTQYRMHPDICRFPSTEFYAGTLKSGEGVALATARPWHATPCFGPLAVFDTPGKEGVPENSSSLENKVEAELVLSLYHQLIRRHPELKTSPSVAVISPYKAQVTLLRDKFRSALGDGDRMVDINTIDGFQGREKDVVIFSTVRTRRGGSIGFVADERRINVGLTRARASLIVVGHAQALKRDSRWRALLRHAEQTRCLYRPTKPFKDYLEAVIDGRLGPVETPKAANPKAQEDAWAPQAEPGVFDEEDAVDDDPTARSVPALMVKGTTNAHRKAMDLGGPQEDACVVHVKQDVFGPAVHE